MKDAIGTKTTTVDSEMETELIVHPIDPTLLAGLTEAVTPTDVSLAFSRNLTMDECRVLMASAYQAENRCNWYLGDLIIHAEEVHGDNVYQLVADALGGISESRYKHLKHTAARFTTDERRRATWSVYRELSWDYIPDDVRDELLDQAEEGDLSSREVAELRNDSCPRPTREWDLSDVISAVEKAFQRISLKCPLADVAAMLRKWRNVADEYQPEDDEE